MARIAESLANSVGWDLLNLAYRRNGIRNADDNENSGEIFFLDFLNKQVQKKERPVIFDVGANIGKYTKLVAEHIPSARIFSFEPNPNSFRTLTESVKALNNNNISVFNFGLSSVSDDKIMYSYKSDVGSTHTSVLHDVLTDLHRSEDNVEIKAQFASLDQFCREHKIDHIDFLKIDTEGHELEVLKGASSMLSEKKIDVIQFEFGECHVYSRVFVRDFYTLLPGYDFSRLMPAQMRPLGKYSPDLEIFHFQNIVAMRKE